MHEFSTGRASLLLQGVELVVQRLEADPQLLGGRLLLKHDCNATRGSSGAPVLVQGSAGWVIGGINVAAPRGQVGGLASTVDEARKQ